MGSDNLFYVTLLNNGSQTLYPDNTVGAFITELAVQSISTPNLGEKLAYMNVVLLHRRGR
jgi:hypothetical protein